MKETLTLMMNTFKPNARLVLALCAVVVLALLFTPAATSRVDAQAASCFEVVYEMRTTSIPFLPGLQITRNIKVGVNFDEDCNTPNDGRANINDNAAAAAVYCTPYGVSIWDIDDISRGTPSFLVTYDALDTIPWSLDENILVAENGGFRLYALTSGELQLNSPPDWEGKEYVFTWAGCERPAS